MRQLASMATIIFLLILPLAQAQDQPGKSVFSNLRQGQKVNLKEVSGGRFEIQVIKDIPGVSKITDIGRDYIVIEDAFGFTELRIPVTSISVIRSIKGPK
ncbi:MAG: hypothetical protein ACKO9Z_07670 [Planctomycetota bacterium]